MEYVLVEWSDNEETGNKIAVRTDNPVGTGKLYALTNRLVLSILRQLNDAKQGDPGVLYLPMAHFPSNTGAVFWVLRDAFILLGPDFKNIIQDSLVGANSRRGMTFAVI